VSLVQLGLTDKLRGLHKFVAIKAVQRPLGVTLELTRRCNAKCDYCDHWREPKRKELDADGFVDVVQRFDPLSVTLCGGEPFIRQDVLDIARRIKGLRGYRYLSIITNGWFLKEEKASELLATGINQVNISLNYPDERQDEDRKLKGLFGRIAHIVPWMTARGAQVQLNTILMRDNLREALRIVNLAESWGATVLFTLYSDLPAGNRDHMFGPELRAELRDLCTTLIQIRRTRGLVANEEWYLENVPGYVEGRRVGGCTAGRTTIHVTPEGQVRPCAELPPVEHYSTYVARHQPWTDCTDCFQACRGEAQAPVDMNRIVEYLRT
jgi:MoaA/NifB/PqqE/SkfB family radical SAM enzyme